MSKVIYVRRRLTVLAPAGPLYLGKEHLETAFGLQIQLPQEGDAGQGIYLERFACSPDIANDLLVKLEINGHKRTVGFVKASLLQEMQLRTVVRSHMIVQATVMATKPLHVDCGLICQIVVNENP